MTSSFMRCTGYTFFRPSPLSCPLPGVLVPQLCPIGNGFFQPAILCLRGFRFSEGGETPNRQQRNFYESCFFFFPFLFTTMLFVSIIVDRIRG